MTAELNSLMLGGGGFIPDGASIRYTMDNVSGTSLVNEVNPGTFNSGLFNSPSFVAGQDGNEIQTNGTNQYTATGNLPLLNDSNSGTIAFIANASIAGSVNRCAVGFGSASGANAAMARITSGNRAQWNLNIGGTTTNFNGDTPITTGYHLITISSTGSTYKMTVDGVVQSLTFTSGSNNGNWVGDLGVSTSMDIGRLPRSDGPFYYPSGVDELMYFDAKVLTDEEIQGLYDFFF